PGVRAIADVAADDDRLMEVRALEEDADAPGTGVVDVRVGQQEVAIAPDRVHAVAAATDQDAGDRRLHRAIARDPVGPIVPTFDLDPRDGRHPRAPPDLGPDVLRVGRLVVRPDYAQGRPGALHHQPGRAALARDRRRPVPAQLDQDRPGQ